MIASAGSGDGLTGIAICVPARDESDRLPRLFDAIEGLLLPPGTALSLCLLLDGCTDGSAAVTNDYARRSRHDVHVATAERCDANAGIARHRAMQLGASVLGDGGGVLLTTDADSWPQSDWLGATMAALHHADLIVGDVVRGGHAIDNGQDRVELYYARLFAFRRRTDPVPWEATHMHHHASGANMAMRTHVYAALGGFPPLASGEDARLVDDAARAGFRVRHDAASVVHTSGRRHGRAQDGLAANLRLRDRDGLDGIRVAHPVDQAWQYRAHALARLAFDTGSMMEVSNAVGLTPDHLFGVARDCPNAEAFAMRAVPIPPGGMRQVPLAVAETALAALCATAAPARAA